MVAPWPARGSGDDTGEALSVTAVATTQMAPFDSAGQALKPAPSTSKCSPSSRWTIVPLVCRKPAQSPPMPVFHSPALLLYLERSTRANLVRVRSKWYLDSTQLRRGASQATGRPGHKRPSTLETCFFWLADQAPAPHPPGHGNAPSYHPSFSFSTTLDCQEISPFFLVGALTS